MDTVDLKYLQLYLPPELTPEAHKTLHETLANLQTRYQIEVSACELKGNLTEPDGPKRQETLERLQTQIRHAAELGCQCIHLVASTLPSIDVSESAIEGFDASIQFLAEYAAASRLRLSLLTRGIADPEATPGEFFIESVLTNRDWLEPWIPRLPDHVGFAYEPAMFKAINPSDLRWGFDLLRDHIDCCILYDWTPRDRQLQRTLVGNDDLDYRPILQTLKPTTPYYITLPQQGDPQENLQRSLAYLRQLALPVTATA